MTRAIIASRFGVAAAGLGGAAGVAELITGTTKWTGDKDAPGTLGVVTIGLAVTIGVLALVTRRAPATGRLGAGVVTLLAGMLGVTTAGVAWLPAAASATVAGAFAIASVPQRERRATAAVLWPRGLLLVPLAVYLTFGAVAGGARGLLGLIGAITIAAAMVVRTPSRALATLALVAGVVPFAVVTWWTLVVPLSAAIALVIALPALAPMRRAPAR